MDLWPRIHEHCPDIKFKLVPYESTPENAREILRNLGERIDIVAGPFDQNFLAARQCAALELSREPVQCAVSIYLPLAQRERLTVRDFYGENFLLIRRGWNHTIPFGLLHSPGPSDTVRSFLNAVKTVLEL